MYSRKFDGAILPDLSPVGNATSEAFPTGTWNCSDVSFWHDWDDSGTFEIIAPLLVF